MQNLPVSDMHFPYIITLLKVPFLRNTQIDKCLILFIKKMHILGK